MNFVDRFVEWCSSQVFENDKALEYLRGRGVTDDQIKLHRIGYCPGLYVCDEDLDGEDCKEMNRWSKGGELLNKSIILPITSYTGKTYGFQSRSLDKKNYETYIIKRRPEAFFFGIGENMDSIWSKKSIIITEGAFDQLIAERYIGRNSVAILTNTLSNNHAKFITRFTDNVVFCLDNDRAGLDGLDRSSYKIKSIRKDIEINVVKIKGAKDLNELWVSSSMSSIKQVAYDPTG